MDHDRGVGGLDDGRTLDLVAASELLAVVHRSGPELPEVGPVDRAGLALGFRRDRFAVLRAANQLRLWRQSPRAQPHDDDLELRAGKRRAAAVELFVTVREHAAQPRLV